MQSDVNGEEMVVLFTTILFSSAVFPIEADLGVKAELWGDFSKMDGTILSIKAPGQELMFALVANNNTKVCS